MLVRNHAVKQKTKAKQNPETATSTNLEVPGGQPEAGEVLWK